MTTVLLIAGTGEGPLLADLLNDRGLRVIATTTTPAGARLFARCRGPVDVRVCRFDDESLAGTIRDERVGCVLNAAHPFAVEIGRRVLRTAARLDVPLIRFERPPINVEGATRVYPDFAAVAADPYLHGRRIMLAVGCRPLHLFAGLHRRAQLFARVMPTVEAVAAAMEAGFDPERIVALRPPIGRDLEEALIRHFRIDTLVAKESGAAGGQDVKQASAARAGGPALLLVRRPTVEYPRTCTEPAAAADAVAEAARRSKATVQGRVEP